MLTVHVCGISVYGFSTYMNVVRVCGMFVCACVQCVCVVCVCMSSVLNFSVYMCMVTTVCTCMCVVQESEAVNLLNLPPLHHLYLFILPIHNANVI